MVIELEFGAATPFSWLASEGVKRILYQGDGLILSLEERNIV
ncbi:hypothetical protein [Rhizobium cauense]|nr:hypothetical protein [Rhizobium cauense]